MLRCAAQLQCEGRRACGQEDGIAHKAEMRMAIDESEGVPFERRAGTTTKGIRSSIGALWRGCMQAETSTRERKRRERLMVVVKENSWTCAEDAAADAMP